MSNENDAKRCNSIGPFQALCEKMMGHEGRHRGVDASSWTHTWTSEDYPEVTSNEES